MGRRGGGAGRGTERSDGRRRCDSTEAGAVRRRSFCLIGGGGGGGGGEGPALSLYRVLPSFFFGVRGVRHRFRGGVTELYLVFLVFTGFYLVLAGFIEFYLGRVLFIEFYPVMVKFYRVLRSVIGFYPVLPNSAGSSEVERFINQFN